MQSRSSKSPFERWALPGSLAIALVAAVIGAVFFAWRMSLTVPTNHFDGAYQTASGLYRLAAGEHPGKDFLPYLGIGPLYLLYPIFVAAGGDIAASVISARLMTLFTQAVSVFALSWFLLSGRRYQVAAFFAVICIMTAVSVSQLYQGAAVDIFAVSPASSFRSIDAFLRYWGAVTDMFAVSPGNSLRPIRAFLPYLSAILAYAVIRLSASPSIRNAGLGAVSGLCLVWSNDFGLPTFALLMVFSVVLAVQQRECNARNMSILIVTAVVVGALGVALGTGGSVAALLRYNFQDVARDQWWYFGSWRESRRIFSIFDIQKIFWRWDGACVAFGLAILSGVAIIAWRRRSLEKWLVVYIGTALFAGGFLPSVGGHLDFGYFVAFMVWCFATVAIASVLLSGKLIKARLGPIARPTLVNIVFFALVVGPLIWAYAQATATFKARAQIASDSQRFFVAELGGYLGVGWQPYVAEARARRMSPVMEEYWGIWSAIRHRPNAIPVDSVIHALGATRDRVESYVATLPDLLVSSRQSAGGEWQPWTLSANWWFYRHVLKNYHPAMLSPATILWEKGEPRNWPEVACTPTRPDTIKIGATEGGLYEVTAEYKFEGSPTRSLLFVRNNIVLARESKGYLSIDPHAATAIFPVFIRAGDVPELDFKVQSASFAKVGVVACAARMVAPASASLLAEIITE
jgi:hypothetical protein